MKKILLSLLISLNILAHASTTQPETQVSYTFVAYKDCNDTSENNTRTVCLKDDAQQANPPTNPVALNVFLKTLVEKNNQEQSYNPAVSELRRSLRTKTTNSFNQAMAFNMAFEYRTGHFLKMTYDPALTTCLVQYHGPSGNIFTHISKDQLLKAAQEATRVGKIPRRLITHMITDTE